MIVLSSALIGIAGPAQAASDIDVGGAPSAIAVDPLLHEAFVLDQPISPREPWNTEIRVFDTRTGARLTSLWGDEGSTSIAVDPVDSEIYLTNPAGHFVTVHSEDPAQNWWYKDDLGDATPESVAVDYVSHKAFVTTIEKTGPFEIHRLLQIDGGATIYPSVKEIARLGNNLDVGGIAVDSTLGQVYVANKEAGTVSVVSERTGTFASVDIPVGSLPTSVAVDQQSHEVYVSDTGSNAVSVLDGLTHSNPAADIPLDGSPMGITVDQGRNAVFIAVASTDGTDAGALTEITGPAHAVSSMSLPQAPMFLVTDWLAHRVFFGRPGTGVISQYDEP